MGRYTFTLAGATLPSGGTTGEFDAVAEGAQPGFVRVAPGKQYFQRDTGELVYVLGENMAFPGRDPILTTYNYTNDYKVRS